MKENGYQDQLRHEVDRLREIALKSTDDLLVSKAVAASDPVVQQMLLKRLEAGERLVEVFAWAGTSLTEIKVFFRFSAPDQSVHLVDSGLLAFVDSPRGEVIGAIDPYTLQPEHRQIRPFVLVNAPSASELTTEAADPQQAARERAFLERLRIRDPWGGVYTVDPTIFGTETFSGGGTDDNRSDRTCDYHDCAPGTTYTA